MARAWAHAGGCAACRRALDAVFPATESLQEGEDPVPPLRAEEPPEWKPPEYFGSFRLGPEIGRGAMGVVYRARNLSVRRDVALKFIASAGTNSRVEAFFDNEARLLASFNHPNIITLYSVGQVDGHPYIETELIEGQRLADLPRPLPSDQVLELGLGLARGLEAAHAKHVLHRDIKPSNVIKTNDGWVKLLDFGLAEHVDPDAPEGARSAAGTLVYMAPECAEGAPATERSDIYSLGAVLYQLCADRVPLEGARLGPGVKRALAEVIERCIRADPAERYASAKLLVQALETLPRVPAPAANPYRGLAPFEAEHQSLFFGRDADIRRILDRLNRQPMVLVAAESGVGKSSVCRAGIVARADGQVVAGRTLTAVTLTPGRKPLDALAGALAPVLELNEQEMFTRLADEPGSVGRQVRDAFQGRGGVLLFVDQLEELVTLSDASEREGFALALAELARPSGAVRVLLAVRGDFFTRVAELPGLADLAERALYLLQPMSASGVYEAIVAPARACGVSFESDALVEELVNAAATGRGGLPLLSFALAELWERRDRERAQITAAALRALGGIEGLLARHADGVVGPLTDAQLREARRLLLRLITEDRTRIERSALELGAESPDAQAALRALVQGRLLQVRADGGQVLYQITHDSLIHSWPRLVAWIEEDQGHAVVRRRVEAAAAEWERLKRSGEALWPKRPLDEARSLDPFTLTAGEREFLQISRRRVTRRWWLRRLAAVLAVSAVAAAYGAFRVQKTREEVAFVVARQTLVRGQLDEAGNARKEACAQRVDALRWFDPPQANRPEPLPEGETSRWEVGEKRWAAALATHARAQAMYEGAQRTLEGALERQYDRDGSRQILFDATYGRLELEECFHPQGAGSPAVGDLLNRFEDPRWRERVDVPAQLELTVDPPGAAVAIARYTESGGRLNQEAVPAPADRSRLQLQPGSYLFSLSAPGRAPVALPVLLGRGQRERARVALPAQLPDGMVYVPPGCFLEGSDDEALRTGLMEASPLHRVCMERGYLIGRTEITFGDWLQYLATLPSNAEARHLLERLPPSSGGFMLRWEPVSGWALSFHRSGHRIFGAWEGEDFRYKVRTRNATGDWRALPLLGVSALDLEGYFAWLDRSGRLPGARLCREDEWERAARGADARAYPAGDRLFSDDADFDATYGREPDAYGPDVAGAHPKSSSPFGLADMAGNAFEMTTAATPEQGRIVLRGGSWYQQRQAAFVACRSAGELSTRDPVVGARVCAPSPTE